MKFILVILIIGFLLYTGLMGWLVDFFAEGLVRLGYFIMKVGLLL